MKKTPLRDPESPHHVLVVEDEPRLRDMLVRAIKDMGFLPNALPSAEQALPWLQEHTPPVVILDLTLPGMGGMALFEIIRERWPRTQVIILTGYGDLKQAKKAIHLDVVDFLTKPCSLGELEVAIDRAWQRTAQLAREEPAIASANAQSPDTQRRSRQAGSLQDFEREHILQALTRNNGHRAATATELNISVRTLYYRLAEYQRKGLFDDKDRSGEPPATA